MCRARPPRDASLVTPTDGPLTQRELEVLRLLVVGHTNREIAELLHVSVRTSEFHRASIRRKLGLSSRAQLVAYAAGRGLLGPAGSTHVTAERAE
jgi:DNA-binding CsgD family transcriptional regulator